MPRRTTPNSEPGAGPPVAHARLMTASAVGMVMFGAVQVAPAVCLDAMGRELQLNFEQRGILMALRMAALTACLLVVGHFVERIGKRHVMFWGLVAIALGMVLVARAQDYPQMLVAMLVSGLGFGVFEALINPLIAQLHPHDGARALNAMNGLFSLGLVAGALGTGELLQAGYSWRLAFWLWSALPLICAALYLTPHYPVVAATSHGSAAEVRRFLRMPLFWVLAAAMVMGGGAEAGLTSWSPNLVTQVLGASARGGAWTTILYGTCMALGRFGTGAVVTRVGALRLMLVSAVLCGLVTWGLAVVPTLWGAHILFALSGFCVACFWPTLLSLGSDGISRGSTSLFSLLGAAGVTGCVIVPWAIGALGDVVGLQAAVLLLPVSMGLMVALLLIGARFMHHHPAPPSDL